MIAQDADPRLGAMKLTRSLPARYGTFRNSPLS